ncbi:MAG: Uma2 family endonuclease [Treponema sp.]|nr:Uma2 family endonuclease [Treponema sp.]
MLYFSCKQDKIKEITYKQYNSWSEDIRCELIDGIPYMMSSPTRWHQQVAGNIHGQLWSWLEGKPCEVYIAPFDVRLFPEDDESDKIVLQPDVMVVCGEKKLSDGRACKGAPDFVVEVVSKSSQGRDFAAKKALYEKAGVREYWVVDEGAVYKYVPIDGVYEETVYELETDSKIEVEVLPGCSINFR